MRSSFEKKIFLIYFFGVNRVASVASSYFTLMDY